MPTLETEFVVRHCSPETLNTKTRQLAAHEVHLWYASAGTTPFDAKSFAQLLSADEKDRMERFRFRSDQDNFLFCRSVLRILLASYVGSPPAELRFAYSGHGKPTLADSSINLDFNLSHCNEKLLVAFCLERRIGVDIERVRRNLQVQEIATRFFSPTERHALLSLPAEAQYEAFFACWTRKEAYVKARGEGLSQPLDSFDVSVDPGERKVSLTTRPDADEANQWELWSLSDMPGFCAAVAISRESVSA